MGTSRGSYDTQDGPQFGGEGGVVDRLVPGGSTGPWRERGPNAMGPYKLDDYKVTGRDGWKPHAERVARYMEDRFGVWCENGHASYLPDLADTSIDVWGGTGFAPLDEQTGSEIASMLSGGYKSFSVQYFIWLDRIWTVKTRRYSNDYQRVGPGDVRHLKHLHLTLTDKPGEDHGEGTVASRSGTQLDDLPGWMRAIPEAIATGFANALLRFVKAVYGWTVLRPLDHLGGFFWELTRRLANFYGEKATGTGSYSLPGADVTYEGDTSGSIFEGENATRLYLLVFGFTTYWLAFGRRSDGSQPIDELVERGSQAVGPDTRSSNYVDRAKLTGSVKGITHARRSTRPTTTRSVGSSGDVTDTNREDTGNGGDNGRNTSTGNGDRTRSTGTGNAERDPTTGKFKPKQSSEKTAKRQGS